MRKDPSERGGGTRMTSQKLVAAKRRRSGAPYRHSLCTPLYRPEAF